MQSVAFVFTLTAPILRLEVFQTKTSSVQHVARTEKAEMKESSTLQEQTSFVFFDGVQILYILVQAVAD